MFLKPSGKKSGDHGIACAYRIDDMAFGCSDDVNASGFIRKQCTVAGTGNEYVSGTHFLHFLGIKRNFFGGRQSFSEDLTKLVVIRLDEKRLVYEHVF